MGGNILKHSHIYSPVYYKLEKEVINLSNYIFFEDNQKDVYSLEIADLIMRCSVEIESLAKDIYRENEKKEPSSPGECFRWMDQHWQISNKEITVISPHFHINCLNIFEPFNYDKDSPEDYYSIYNSIKHDRVKNLDKATVYCLIRALGALYVLNVYYNAERVNLGEDTHGQKFDRTLGSQIFAFSIAPSPDNILLTSEKDIDPQKCIYKVIRKESEYAFKILYKNMFDEIKSSRMLMINAEFQKLIQSYLGKSMEEKDFWNKMSEAGDMTEEQAKNNFYINNKVKSIVSITAEKMKATYWAELNI